jgi:hypothetical protein
MTQSSSTWQGALARLRTAAAAEQEKCAHFPALLEALLRLLLLCLFAQPRRLPRIARTLPALPLRSRSRARIAAGRVPPRAARPERFLDWWLRMNFGGVITAIAPPPPPRRPLRRTPPPDPAPAPA